MSFELEATAGYCLDEKVASKRLGVSVALMRKWRRMGGGPRFCKFGSRVLYSEAEIGAFIDAHTVEGPSLTQQPIVATNITACQ